MPESRTPYYGDPPPKDKTGRLITLVIVVALLGAGLWGWNTFGGGAHSHPAEQSDGRA